MMFWGLTRTGYFYQWLFSFPRAGRYVTQMQSSHKNSLAQRRRDRKEIQKATMTNMMAISTNQVNCLITI